MPLAYAAAVPSPTYNEPAHPIPGISYWQPGEFSLYLFCQSALVRLVAATPAIVLDCRMDWRNLKCSQLLCQGL